MGPAGRQVDALLETGRLPDHVQTQDLRPAGVRQQQGGQNRDEGGLAGAVGPQYPEDGPGRHRQVHLAEHFLDRTPQSGAEALADSLSQDSWLHNYRRDSLKYYESCKPQRRSR